MKRVIRIAALAAPLLVARPAPSFGERFQPIVFKVNDPDPNDLARTNDLGRLKKTDEEFTNEQAVVKFFADGVHGLYVEMRTGALASGETPIHRMQGACTPITLTQGQGGAVEITKGTGERFVTDNDGNEYRNANKPELMPINGGRNMLYMFNYQPEGTDDTRRYAKVLDMSCNEIPVTNANGEARKQVQIMAKNNDDCDMHQEGEGPCDVASDGGGVTHLACWAGCNGNGRDDGWLNDIAVSCETDVQGNAASCRITKNFDISLAQREERSRGRCSIADEDPQTAICTWTEGNNQPQRDGTWIAAVDISPGGEQGPDAESRLLWKEQIDGRKEREDGERTYSVRAMHTRILLPDGQGNLVRSNMLFFRSGDLQGRNNDNDKGGTYRAFQMGIIKATREGMSWVVPLHDTTDMMLGIDGTHLVMCGAVFGEGEQVMPGATFLMGSHNGGGVQDPVAKAVGFDLAAGQLVDLGTHRVGGSYDRHLYSNYLGNNPGNQGRNFAGCALVKNPFAGTAGNRDAWFVAHALTGKAPEYVDRPEIKPSSFVTLLPVVSLPEPPADPPPGDPPTTGDPGGSGGEGGGETGMGGEPMGGSGGSVDQKGTPLFGCAVGQGGEAGSAWLLLALVYLTRKRTGCARR